MNYRKVVRFSASIVTVVGLALSVSAVAASELTLPQQFTHEGLTFSSGLIYTEAVPTVPLRLSFGTVEEIAVTQTSLKKARDTEQQEVLAEQIITPAPKELELITTAALPALVESLKASEEKTVIPMSAPTPTTLPSPTDSTASLPAYATDGRLSADVLFSLVNQKRAEAGLLAFEKHPDICALAESRKPEIENELYGNSALHAGFRARDLPWRATENLISQQTEEKAINWWMNSSIHRSAILGSAKYACIACQNKSCAMIFSSLEPK